jgi:quercetin dioxygenase-like cupin family protein
MGNAYTFHADLNRPLELPADGTMSRTLLQDERTKVVLFNFCAGQELSEHTAATPAIMHFLAGEAEVTLGPDAVTATAGTWIHMPPQLPHSIRANTPVVMLLTLLKPSN